MSTSSDMKMTILNEGQDPTKEENMTTINKIVQVIIRTAERYFREQNIEKGKEIVEGLDKFRLGIISLENLHSLLLDKDKCVGEITESIELYVPAYLIRVDGGKFPFILPTVPIIQEPPPEQPAIEHADTVPAPTENDAHDSFNQTLDVVPKTQVPDTSPNARKLTSYDDVMHITFIKIDVLSKYPFKYINLLGQAISVFNTKKGSTFVRYWDGSAHRANQRSFNLFLAEDDMIESFSTTARASLADIPPTHYIDIEVYGEYIDVAQTIRSGDIVAFVNLHLYKNKILNRDFVVTLHEGGKNYARDLFILDEEERSVEQMKRKFCDIADKENLGRSVDGHIKMVSKSSDKMVPSVNVQQVAPIDDAQSAVTDNCEQPSSSSKTANAVLNNQDDVQLSPLKRPEEPFTKKPRVILCDESGSDEIILDKKGRNRKGSNVQEEPGPTRNSPIILPTRTEDIAAKSRDGSVTENSQQRRPVVQNNNQRVIPMRFDPKEFFRKRVQSCEKSQSPTILIKYVPGERLVPAKKDGIEISVQAEPEKRSTSVQTGRTKPKNMGIQTSPIKESPIKQSTKSVQTGITKSKSIAIQTTPIKESPLEQLNGKEIGTRKRKLLSGATNEATENVIRRRTEPNIFVKEAPVEQMVTRSRSKKLMPIKTEVVSIGDSSLSNAQNTNLMEADQDIEVLCHKRTRRYQSAGVIPPPPPVRRSSLSFNNPILKNSNAYDKRRSETAPRLPPHGRRNEHQTPEKGQKISPRIGSRYMASEMRDFPIPIIGSATKEKKPPITRSATSNSPKKPVIRASTPRLEEKPVINAVLVSPPLHAKAVQNNKRR